MIQRWAATAVVLAASVAAWAPASHADPLTDIYARILVSPEDIELNLQYALLAEGRGEYRKALATYERILVNDPDNEAARRGLTRVRRIIQPPSTQVFAEAGGTWESNPRRVAFGESGDYLGYGRLRVQDERPIAGRRWRTIGTLYGEAYAANHDLSYANLAGGTGPLIDLGATMLALYPSVGAGASYYRERLFYWDVNAAATLESYLQGAFQWVRLRGGYRQYDPFFTSGSGFYGEARARFNWQNVVHDDDVASVSPWIYWSGIEGTITNALSSDFSPGRYLAGGVTLEYSKKVSDRLTVALNLRLSDRYYFVDLAPSGGNRQDFLISPGATESFTNLFGPQTELRLAYRFDHNDSNDPDHDYRNHALTLAIVARR